jgi:hypothetical protein
MCRCGSMGRPWGRVLEAIMISIDLFFFLIHSAISGMVYCTLSLALLDELMRYGTL